MLVRRMNKTVFLNKSNKAAQMNMPIEIVRKFGLNYYLDVYEDRIVMYPVENLGKIKED